MIMAIITIQFGGGAQVLRDYICVVHDNRTIAIISIIYSTNLKAHLRIQLAPHRDSGESLCAFVYGQHIDDDNSVVLCLQFLPT